MSLTLFTRGKQPFPRQGILAAWQLLPQILHRHMQLGYMVLMLFEAIEAAVGNSLGEM